MCVDRETAEMEYNFHREIPKQIPVLSRGGDLQRRRKGWEVAGGGLGGVYGYLDGRTVKIIRSCKY